MKLAFDIEDFKELHSRSVRFGLQPYALCYVLLRCNSCQRWSMLIQMMDHATGSDIGLFPFVDAQSVPRSIVDT